MNSFNLKIDSERNSLKFQIKNKSSFNLIHIYMLSILTFGHVIFALLIFTSISSDGIIIIKVAFVIFGLFGLWTINKQFREILIFNKGNEEIEIDDNYFHYNGEFGIFKKTYSLKLNKIKRIKLTPLGEDKICESSNMFTQIKYGMIVLEKSRRKKISFGQSLNKQELETLFAEIEKKLKLPTPV